MACMYTIFQIRSGNTCATLCLSEGTSDKRLVFCRNCRQSRLLLAQPAMAEVIAQHCVVMITGNFKGFKGITQEIYGEVTANLPLYGLRCSCGHAGCLVRHGYYSRRLKTRQGTMRHDLYSLYKSGTSEDIRRKARKEYLDRLGIRDAFRWNSSQDVNVTHDLDAMISDLHAD